MPVTAAYGLTAPPLLADDGCPVNIVGESESLAGHVVAVRSSPRGLTGGMPDGTYCTNLGSVGARI